jgi:hypothetical protein
MSNSTHFSVFEKEGRKCIQLEILSQMRANNRRLEKTAQREASRRLLFSKYY